MGSGVGLDHAHLRSHSFTAACHSSDPRNAIQEIEMQAATGHGVKRIAVAGATGRVGRRVVDVLEAGGHDAVAMSRASGVDVVTGRA
jgi:hypothetical protein